MHLCRWRNHGIHLVKTMTLYTAVLLWITSITNLNETVCFRIEWIRSWSRNCSSNCIIWLLLRAFHLYMCNTVIQYEAKNHLHRKYIYLQKKSFTESNCKWVLVINGRVSSIRSCGLRLLPPYLHTNSPEWTLNISVQNKLREFS